MRLTNTPFTEDGKPNSDSIVTGGAFDGVRSADTPFGFNKCEGADAGAGEAEWVVNRDRPKYDPIFFSMNPVDNKVTGAGEIWWGGLQGGRARRGGEGSGRVLGPF